MYKLTKANISKLQKNPVDVLKTLSDDDVASILTQANQSYYNDKDPVFSDAIYDLVKDYLENKNPEHPALKAVGAVIAEDDKRKAELPFYMGSLDKIKEAKDLDKFTKKYPGDCVVSDKLDGNSGLLYLNKGQVKLYTRGDGTVGQDVSAIQKYIKNIPDLSKQKGELAVRGEFIISKTAFEKVAHLGANARNMVAGVLNAKVPNQEIAKSAEFVAYELIAPKMLPDEQMDYMKKLGFVVVFNKTLKETKLTVADLSDLLINRRDKGDYEIDGIVVMHNKAHNRTVGKNPDYGFAFKSLLTMQKAEVTVINVEWNLSKDGYLVPTVIFNAVAVGGVTIQKATGFNGKFINENKIGPGSKLVIMRRGDVIPHIEEIISHSETGQPQMPEVTYVWSKSGVDIILSDANKKDNDEFKFKNFENFFKKIEIAGLGPGNLKKIFDTGFDTPKKLIEASAKDLLSVDGFKSTTANKIHAAIAERINTLDCLTIMEASNTLGRGLGAKKLDIIVKEFPDILSKRYVPSILELVSLKGIEKTTATMFIENLPSFFKFIDDNGLKCVVEVPKKAAMAPAAPSSGEAGPSSPPKFTDMKVVFTGFRDKDLEAYIVANGGEVVGSVSKKTTLVVAKDVNEDSGKITKAKELGVKVLSLDQFIKEYKEKKAPAAKEVPIAKVISFEGQKIVFSGIRSKDLEKFITDNGGEVTSAVSKKTTLVLVKRLDDDTGKATKAKELGIKIQVVDDFMKAYNM